MSKTVTLSQQQYESLCARHGKERIDTQIAFLNSIFKKSDSCVSHTIESEIDFTIISLACSGNTK